jgi:hypothetical protein
MFGGLAGGRSRPCGLPPVDWSFTTLPCLSRCELEPVRGTYSPEGLVPMRLRLRLASRPTGLSVRLVLPLAVVLSDVKDVPWLLPDCAPVACAKALVLTTAAAIAAARQSDRTMTRRARCCRDDLVMIAPDGVSAMATQLARPRRYLPEASVRACLSAATMSA